MVTVRRLLLALALVVGLGACTAPARFPKATRTAPPPLPAYPEMRQAATREVWGGDSTLRTTTFQTADRPEAVVDFYRDRLLKEGWQPDSAARPVFHDRKACPLYHLYIETTRTVEGTTQVELQLAEAPCTTE